MPYQRLLDELLRSVRADAALLLDGEGEVAIQSGARDERHRLIGAYQGIGLTAARKTLARHDGGGPSATCCAATPRPPSSCGPSRTGTTWCCRCPVDGRIAEGIHHSERTQEKLNREL